MPLGAFHPVVADWFRERFGAPTPPQAGGWPEIAGGRHTLIAAPTGSGKTLAAFLVGIDALVKEAERGTLGDSARVVYVSPLKALSNDVEKNLNGPLAEIRALALLRGLALPALNVAVRTGDTPQKKRAEMSRRAPHILVSTPESLYILLTSERARQWLSTVHTVIVDEIHAVAQDKRGSHLALTLERLDALVSAAGGSLQRIGLSATQRPIERLGEFLVGDRPPPAIVDAGFLRDIDLALELPKDELASVASHELMAEVTDRIAALVAEHRSTLVFVNTRRMAERLSHQLSERLGAEHVAAHHGSLSKETRLKAEERLKNGQIRCVVATASLELGIDVGAVDLVVQLGSPRAIAAMLQRVGRSGHFLGGLPKGRLFALTRDQLVECASLVRAIRGRRLDAVRIPEAPLDILAQQIVAMTAAEDWEEEALFARVRRAHPYRALPRARFAQVVEMLAEGVTAGQEATFAAGRSTARIHRDRVQGRLRGRKGARLLAITSGGAIPDNADYAVIAEPDETFVGTLNEDFAIESSKGDIFLLGNTSWRIRRVEAGRVRVEDAAGQPPTIPFWLGEAPARTKELSEEVSALREEVSQALAAGLPHAQIAERLSTAGLPLEGATQVVAYLAATVQALGAMPTGRRLVVERFFDEGGGMQLVFHMPVGGRVNRGFGLALRKTFCRTFDFELQAAATDDGLVLSLGPMHSFPLESAWSFLSPKNARHLLEQALLAAPMFGVRWRWNAQRALAVPRFQGGKRVPPQLLRMRTDDMLAGVFPAAQACFENLPKDIELPDHPLVQQTVHDCMNEAMDLDGLITLLTDIQEGRVEVLAKDTTEPSPLSHELLNANPYAFLDDAPLEERRTRAVALRNRGLPTLEGQLAALDPEAIHAVVAEVRPEARDADEVHDALLSLGLLPVEGLVPGWEGWLVELAAAGRAQRLEHDHQGTRRLVWVARERYPLVAQALTVLSASPELPPLPGLPAPPGPEEARKQLVRAHLEVAGPVSAAGVACHLGLAAGDVELALAQLEGEGTVLRGRFTQAGAGELEWCNRRLLARIHRQTLGRLRKEIEPVTPAQLLAFLLRWQHLTPDTRLQGSRGALEAIAQLQGFEAPAAAWERELLPARVRDFEPGVLDALSYGGDIAWLRLSPPRDQERRSLSKSTGLALVLRDDLPWLLAPLRQGEPPPLSTAASEVRAHLERRGACFLRELVSGTRRLPAEVEEALRELVAQGLVTADGFSGLRALFDRTLAEEARPRDRLARYGLFGRVARVVRLDTQRRRGDGTSPEAGAARTALPEGGPARTALPEGGGGRWSLIHTGDPEPPDVEAEARQLLFRYGVLFKDLLARESREIPWRELVTVLRRLEARGEIRGGRFVAGFVGEQYALPEAVEALRATRRGGGVPERVRLAATDPLNLVGILTPGPRVPAVPGNLVLIENGVPLASLEAGRLVPRAPLPPGAELGPRLELMLARGAS